MNPILEINNLRKYYNDFTLKDISFNLDRGYVMGFIGPNGSGKTTTIKLIMNLLKKDGGLVKVFGLDSVTDEKEIKNRIGFVYDENVYYGILTVNEMKKIVAPMYKNWDEKLFQKLIKEFDLNPKKKIDNLSKGMKMKFSLVMALSHHAELIIMDEPTSGLDPVFRSELLDILYSIIQDEGKSILFSTHITSDLERIADYITFINNGSIVFSEEKDKILDKYLLVKGPTDTLDEDMEKELIGLRKSRMIFEGLTTDAKKIRRRLGDQVIIEKASLEDIMVFSVKTKGGR